MTKRPRIGSVVEIKTSRGLSYGQITHFHREPPRYGWLLRIFRGFHASRPKNIDGIVNGPVQFSTFYPVGTAANLGLLEIVTAAAVSAENARFPLFKTGLANLQTGEVEQWWIWNGREQWRADEMTDEMLAYPIRAIVTGDLLHRLIEAEWTSAGRGQFGTPTIS